MKHHEQLLFKASKIYIMNKKVKKHFHSLN